MNFRHDQPIEYLNRVSKHTSIYNYQYCVIIDIVYSGQEETQERWAFLYSVGQAFRTPPPPKKKTPKKTRLYGGYENSQHL